MTDQTESKGTERSTSAPPVGAASFGLPGQSNPISPSGSEKPIVVSPKLAVLSQEETKNQTEQTEHGVLLENETGEETEKLAGLFGAELGLAGFNKY